MKVALLTGHHPRHFYLASQIEKVTQDLLVVSCALGLNPSEAGHHGDPENEAISWFNERSKVEKLYFTEIGFTVQKGRVLPVTSSEINSEEVYHTILKFNPDIIVVYGTPILKGPVINITPKIINLHLGISPYYNGAGTNWWPMYNNEFEYVGTTIHYLDNGVDTGEIIGQCRARLKKGDGPHDMGNKNIIAGCKLLLEILPLLQKDIIPPVKQWDVIDRPIYRMKNFTKDKILEFQGAVEKGNINKWVERDFWGNYSIVDFNNGNPKLVNSSLLKPL